jgi:hypothetical protein
MNGTSVEQHCLMYVDETDFTKFHYITFKVFEFKIKDNVTLGCKNDSDGIPSASGFSTEYI